MAKLNTFLSTMLYLAVKIQNHHFLPSQMASNCGFAWSKKHGQNVLETI